MNSFVQFCLVGANQIYHTSAVESYTVSFGEGTCAPGSVGQVRFLNMSSGVAEVTRDVGSLKLLRSVTQDRRRGECPPNILIIPWTSVSMTRGNHNLTND